MAPVNGGPMLSEPHPGKMPPPTTVLPPRGDIPGVEDFLDETKVL